MIEVLTTGLPNSVQDLGRTGHLPIGVARGGAMDRLALETGNALLGNEPGAAGIEVTYFPFRLRFHVPVSFSVTGATCDAALDGKRLPSNWAHGADAGQTLMLGLPRAGARAYIAFGVGIDVPNVLGSRSTDQKSGYGGLEGRGLERGDRLLLLEAAPTVGGSGYGAAPFRSLPQAGQDVLLRVLAAAETESFTARSRQSFFEDRWLLTSEANRMGFRLQGDVPLARDRPTELLSHGIVPGTVQVPPAGQPIIQMADGNTCGGYPKIATVIEADQGLLAQAPLGSQLRFVETDWHTARRALMDRAGWIAEVNSVASLLRDARPC